MEVFCRDIRGYGYYFQLNQIKSVKKFVSTTCQEYSNLFFKDGSKITVVGSPTKILLQIAFAVKDVERKIRNGT